MKYQRKMDIYPATCDTEREQAKRVKKRKVNYEEIDDAGRYDERRRQNVEKLQEEAMSRG